jgi:hypothetical protein
LFPVTTIKPVIPILKQDNEKKVENEEEGSDEGSDDDNDDRESGQEDIETQLENGDPSTSKRPVDTRERNPILKWN